MGRNIRPRSPLVLSSQGASTALPEALISRADTLLILFFVLCEILLTSPSPVSLPPDNGECWPILPPFPFFSCDVDPLSPSLYPAFVLLAGPPSLIFWAWMLYLHLRVPTPAGVSLLFGPFFPLVSGFLSKITAPPARLARQRCGRGVLMYPHFSFPSRSGLSRTGPSSRCGRDGTSALAAYRSPFISCPLKFNRNFPFPWPTLHRGSGRIVSVRSPPFAAGR